MSCQIPDSYDGAALFKENYANDASREVVKAMPELKKKLDIVTRHLRRGEILDATDMLHYVIKEAQEMREGLDS